METILTSQQQTLQSSRQKKPRLTIGYTYFEDDKQLANLLPIWREWPSLIDIFLVDDGSEQIPALDILKDWDLPDYGPSLQLWKVTENLGFNSHGCRNLIAKYALTDTIAFFDIDMQIATETAGRLMTKVYNPRSFYQHDCWLKHKQEILTYPGHMNSFIINKDLYWEAGGYDESFTGHHWGDRVFIERIKELPDVSERHSGNIVCLNRIGRKGVVDRNIDKTLYYSETEFAVPLPVEEVMKLKGTKSKRLDFPFIKLL